MREKVRRDLLSTYVKHGIEDEEDLDFCIQEFTGVAIPKISYCPNHVSPFQFLADVYFNRTAFSLAFGSRGSGKTFIIEIHNLLKMLFMQAPVEALVAAAAKDQADRGYGYFTGFFRNEPLLARYLLGDPQKAITRLTNGSSLQIVYGTKKGLNGPHTNLVSIDEVELIDYCLSYDTRIEVVRDRSAQPEGIPICELVGKSGFFVYAYSRNQRKFVIRRVKRVAKTGTKDTVKVTYGWWSGKGKHKTWKTESLVVTPEHKLLLMNGQYREAGKLQLGDRLRALNMRILAGDTIYPYYELVLPSTHEKRQVLEHRFIWEQLHGALPKGFVVHHKDENTFNNTPSNLEPMKRASHIQHHHVGSKRSKLAKSRMSASALRRDNANIGRYERPRLPWHDKVYLEGVLRQPLTLREIATQLGCSTPILRKWIKRHGIAPRSESETLGIMSRQANIVKPYTSRAVLFKLYHEEQLTLAQIATRFKVGETTIHYHMKRCKIPVRSREAAQLFWKQDNHTVISVEPYKVVDVYNMEVEGTHNFVVQGGIVCKNSTLEEGLAISMSKNGVPAQDNLSSTRKTSTGTMTRLLEEAEEKHLSVYNFCIWENVEKCTRLCENDLTYGTCRILDKCKGKAHQGTGWYKIEDLIKKAGDLTKAMFSTQFENNDPSGETKVYGETFDEKLHVISWYDGGVFRSFHSIFQIRSIPLNWKRVGSMDFGAHFAFGQYAIDPRYGIWIKEFEYYYHGDRLMARHAKEIQELQSTYMKQSVSAIKRRRIPIFCDPSAKQEILEMKAYGFNCFNAINDLAIGVDSVKKKLEISPLHNLPGYMILDTCIETRREFRTWSHPTGDDGKPDLDAYEDGNDHCLDGDRYAIYTEPRMPKARVKPITVEGL